MPRAKKKKVVKERPRPKVKANGRPELLPGFRDPMTQDRVYDLAISPFGHVMSYDSWMRTLLNFQLDEISKGLNLRNLDFDSNSIFLNNFVAASSIFLLTFVLPIILETPCAIFDKCRGSYCLKFLNLFDFFENVSFKSFSKSQKRGSSSICFAS